jgi:hypothetical protein
VAINVWMAYSRQAGDWFVAGSATNLDLLVALPAPRTRMRVNVRKAGLDTHQIRVLADQLTGTRGCWLEDLRGGISDKLLLHVIERRQNMNEDDVDEDEDEDDEEEPMMMKRPAVPRKERVKRQAKAAAKAVGQGAVMVATNEFGNLALNIVKEKAATVPWLAAALEDPEGREVIKLVACSSSRRTPDCFASSERSSRASVSSRRGRIAGSYPRKRKHHCPARDANARCRRDPWKHPWVLPLPTLSPPSGRPASLKVIKNTYQLIMEENARGLLLLTPAKQAGGSAGNAC